MASFLTLKRKDGNKYRAFVRRKGKQPVSKVFDRKSEAQKWARVMEGSDAHLDAYPDAEARRRTIANVIDAFMLDYRGKDTAIVGRLTWWRTHYGHITLANFNQATVKEGLREVLRQPARRANGKGTTKGRTKSLERNRGPATSNRYKGAISIALAWAVEADWIKTNPVAGIRCKKEPRGRVRWLSETEREGLLKACDESAWSDLGLLVRLALSTGARQGELLALTWADLDLKRKMAHIGDSKSGEPRTLPLVKPVLKVLTDRARPIAGGLLFQTPKDKGRAIAFRPHWEAAVKAAELENFRFHDLRHSAASYLAMSGASLLEIADVLGHKSLAMVKRYSHLSTSHKQKLVGRVLAGKVE
jgi:integrase